MENVETLKIYTNIMNMLKKATSIDTGKWGRLLNKRCIESCLDNLNSIYKTNVKNVKVMSILKCFDVKDKWKHWKIIQIL